VEVVIGPQPPPPLASRNPERNPSGAVQPRLPQNIESRKQQITVHLKHLDFLAVSSTHGSAQLALYDQAMWEKYQLTKLAGEVVPSPEAALVSNTNLGTHFDQHRTLMIEDLGQALRSETMNAIRSPCVAACP
jgi:hypothetical protein